MQQRRLSAVAGSHDDAGGCGGGAGAKARGGGGGQGRWCRDSPPGTANGGSAGGGGKAIRATLSIGKGAKVDTAFKKHCPFWAWPCLFANNFRDNLLCFKVGVARKIERGVAPVFERWLEWQTLWRRMWECPR